MADAGQTVLEMLQAVEDRDAERLQALYHPDICIHWPPGLPYSGDHRGSDVRRMTTLFAGIWDPLQPDRETRRLDPEVAAVSGGTVIVDYMWKGQRPDGTTFRTSTLGRYEVRAGRVIEARMFIFDLKGLIAFIGDPPP